MPHGHLQLPHDPKLIQFVYIPTALWSLVGVLQGLLRLPRYAAFYGSRVLGFMVLGDYSGESLSRTASGTLSLSLSLIYLYIIARNLSGRIAASKNLKNHTYAKMGAPQHPFLYIYIYLFIHIL